MQALRGTYWAHEGRYQNTAQALEKLIPDSGAVSAPRSHRLEKLRRAINVYYDLYNNGLCNRADEFRRVTGIPSTRFRQGRWDYAPELYTALEEFMDRTILAAAYEQGVTELELG